METITIVFRNVGAEGLFLPNGEQPLSEFFGRWGRPPWQFDGRLLGAELEISFAVPGAEHFVYCIYPFLVFYWKGSYKSTGPRT